MVAGVNKLKEKRDLTRVLSALVCVGVVTGHAWAQEQEPVVLLQEHARSQAGLATALRIQLGSTPVQVQPWPASYSLPERIRAAGELAQETHAFAVVWTEPALKLGDGSRLAVLYVVGRHEGRAVLEVVRVPGEHGPDLDRTLALKVSAVLDELRRSALAAPSGALLNAAPPVAEPAPELAQPPAAPPEQPSTLDYNEPAEALDEGPRPHWLASARAGLRAGAQLSPGWLRWGLSGALGPELAFDHWSASLRVGLDVYPSAETTNLAGSISVFEVAPSLLAAVRWTWPAFSVGARAGAEIAFIGASARSASGRPGEQSVSTLSWMLGLELERALSEAIGIAATFDAHLHTLRRTFSVNDTVVADLGRSQFVVGLELIARLR